MAGHGDEEGGSHGMICRAALICIVATTLAGSALGRGLTAADVNGAEPWSAEDDSARAVIIKAQVLLDRAGYSTGAIDGRADGNFTNALRAFQQQNGLAESGVLDSRTWARLIAISPEPVLRAYVITAEDMRGPFSPQIPESFEQKAKLKQLAYTGPAELLAERFHMDEDLLTELNARRPLDRGTNIVVANVKRASPKAAVARVLVEKRRHSVRALDRGGRLVGYFPASLGGGDKPALRGKFRITRVVRDPVYIYTPKFRFPGVDARERLKIAPGPNNPVGSVWMNLNERTYGIHGTAEPAKIGRTPSHGCVRLTNWDASTLAAMVKKGTVVEFID